MHRVPSKAAGPEAPSRSWVEADPSKEYSLAQRQPVSPVDAQLLAEFHLLICEVILQDITEMGVCTGRTRVWRSKKAWFSFFTTRAVSTVSRVLPHSSWDSFSTPWKRVQPLHRFSIFKRPALRRSGPHSPEPQCHGGNGCSESSTCRRPADAGCHEFHGGLHLGGIILINLGVLGWLAIKPMLAGPGHSGWLRRWFWRLGLEKRLEGGQRLEEEASLGLFQLDPIETRDRSTGLPGTLTRIRSYKCYLVGQNIWKSVYYNV